MKKKWTYKIGQTGIININGTKQRYRIIARGCFKDKSGELYEVEYIGKKMASNERLQFIDISDFKPIKGKS